MLFDENKAQVYPADFFYNITNKAFVGVGFTFKEAFIEHVK